MENQNAIYAKISDEERNDVENILFSTVKEHLQVEEGTDGYCKYVVQLQNVKFETFMTNEELRKSISLTVDILEEMKSINNNGINKECLKKLEQKISSEHKFKEDSGLNSLFIWNEIESDRVKEIVIELNQVRRVGGAYALILANPCLRSALYSVFNRLVDCFDDDNLYLKSGYFLLRAIMKMHSTEIKDCD